MDKRISKTRDAIIDAYLELIFEKKDQKITISELAQQSGVAEVLDYAVKVDYWDVDALADAIYGLIKYPALSGMFASKGLEEVTNLKWNDAAAKIKSVYEAVIEENKKQLK